MKELVERWKAGKGLDLAKKVLSGILQGRSIDRLELDKYEGRWDIRGLQFPQFIEAPRPVFRKAALIDTDCSFTSFRLSAWERCRFENVMFISSQMDEVRFSECEFINVSFEKASLRDAVINATLGTGHGSFKNATFLKSDLRATYGNTIFENSTFIDCKLKKVDFHGTRFQDCKFKGTLESVQFHGRPEIPYGPSSGPNKMSNVDFSEATLYDCLFSDGVDLSNCILPENEDHLIIRHNKKAIFDEARHVIETTWADDDKKKGALSMIDRVFINPRVIDQPIEVMNRTLFRKIGHQPFLDLIEKLAKKYG